MEIILNSYKYKILVIYRLNELLVWRTRIIFQNDDKLYKQKLQDKEKLFNFIYNRKKFRMQYKNLLIILQKIRELI